jgi:hypothetical protein
VGITAKDDLCIRGDGAFQDAVVRRSASTDGLGGRDGAGEHSQLLAGLSEFVWRTVELVSQDAEGFFNDGFGNREIDVAVGSEVKKFLRLASELDGR